MKKAKILLLSLVLVYLVQETKPQYHCGYESLIEYAAEKFESREEFVCQHLIKTQAKKTPVNKEKQSPDPRPDKFIVASQFHPTVKRSILYCTLLI